MAMSAPGSEICIKPFCSTSALTPPSPPPLPCAAYASCHVFRVYSVSIMRRLQLRRAKDAAGRLPAAGCERHRGLAAWRAALAGMHYWQEAAPLSIAFMHYSVGAASLSTAYLQQVWQDLLADLATDGAALDQRYHLRQRGRRQPQLGERYARLLQAVTSGESVMCPPPLSFV